MAISDADHAEGRDRIAQSPEMAAFCRLRPTSRYYWIRLLLENHGGRS